MIPFEKIMVWFISQENKVCSYATPNNLENPLATYSTSDFARNITMGKPDNVWAIALEAIN